VTYGYSFDWQMGNDVFAPRTISRTGATSSIDCVSEYAQLVDMSWYLPLASSVSTAVTANVSTFQACVDLCTGACEFVTYDYVARTCTVRNGAEVIFVG
jgi:hypothetical protein